MKTYKNISGLEQLDLAPGKSGQRELTPDEEQRMVARGAIEVVGSSTSKPEDAELPPATPPGVGDPPERIEAERKAAEDAERKGASSGASKKQ